MKKDFMRINIPKLPVMTTEEGIKRIKSLIGQLSEWKNLNELVPQKMIKLKILRKTGLASIFAGSLELVKEGVIELKQSTLFENVFLRQRK